MSFHPSTKTNAATPTSTTCATCHYHASLTALTVGSIAAIAGVAIAFSNQYLPAKFVAQVPHPWIYRSLGIATTTGGITAILYATYDLLHPKVAIQLPQGDGHLQIHQNKEGNYYYVQQGFLQTRLVKDPQGPYKIDGHRYALEPQGPPED